MRPWRWQRIKEQNAHRKSTWRSAFLASMHRTIPWTALCVVVEPHYPKRGNGLPPIGPERMCNKSKIRTRVEHVFAAVERLRGFAKVRYSGMAKNACRVSAALVLANIYAQAINGAGALVVGEKWAKHPLNDSKGSNKKAEFTSRSHDVDIVTGLLQMRG